MFIEPDFNELDMVAIDSKVRVINNMVALDSKVIVYNNMVAKHIMLIIFNFKEMVAIKI